jgi:hypothetical protein
MVSPDVEHTEHTQHYRPLRTRQRTERALRTSTLWCPSARPIGTYVRVFLDTQNAGFALGFTAG